MSNSERNCLWDIAKGLGILFVVAGHGFGAAISNFVNLFHIPLFFFVSGLVFKFKDRSFKSIFAFMFKCIKGLWLPSLIYGVFYVVMHNPFVSMRLYQLDSYTVKEIGIAILKHICFLKTEPLESAMWFLTALFIGRCMLYGVLWISSSFKKVEIQTISEIVLVTVLFATGCFFFYENIRLPGNADNACSLLPFMYAGYKLKKINLSRPWLAIPSFISLLAILIITNGSTLRMSRNELVNPLFFLTASTIGICFTFQIASLIKSWRLGLKAMSYLGRNTISILCLHLLAFRVVSFIWIRLENLPIELLSKHPIIESSYLWGVFYTLFGLIVPLLVPVIIKQIKISGRI